MGGPGSGRKKGSGTGKLKNSKNISQKSSGSKKALKKWGKISKG